MKRIYNYSFPGCINLTTIEVDEENPIFTSEDGVVFNKDKSTLIVCPTGKTGAYTIPENVTTIDYGAFDNCSNLSSITIPNNVTYIGDFCFTNCSNLTSVTIPESVTSIGIFTFCDCSSMTSVTLPESVTSIGEWMFGGCSGLTSITIPNSVTSIGEKAFYNCSGLTSIVIPNSVTTIENNTFDGCSGLTSVFLPNSVSTIGNDAFKGCIGLTSVSIPNSVSTIGNNAFNGCSGLTSVSIPNSVTNIGNDAFFGCNNLTELNVAEDNTEYSSEDGVLYNKDKTTIIRYPAGRISTSYTIPKSVTSIRNNAFSDCKKLTSITCYSQTPPSLDTNKFSGVRNCKVYVPCDRNGAIIDAYKYAWGKEDLTYEAMFLYSFAAKANDDSRGTVEILRMPDCEQDDAWVKATAKDGYKFVIWDNGYAHEENKYMSVNYNSLTNSKTAVAYFEPVDIDVYFPPANNAYWYYDETTKTLNIVGYSNGDFGIYKGWGGELNKEDVEHVVMTGNITGIDTSAFSDFTALKDVVLPPKISSIGVDAFGNCINLESINLPEGVRIIEGGAFSKCEKLKKVVLPQSLIELGGEVFSDCTTKEPMTFVFKGSTPPKIYTNTFLNMPKNSVFIVPCGSLDKYMEIESLYLSRNIYDYQEDFVYSVNVASSDAEGGTARVLQQPDCGTPAIIEATAAEGYRFVGWSDGQTDAKREFEVKKDYNLIAEFVLIGTPIRNISADKLPAKAVKTLIDGRLVIIRDSKMYGITGELIK